MWVSRVGVAATRANDDAMVHAHAGRLFIIKSREVSGKRAVEAHITEL